MNNFNQIDVIYLSDVDAWVIDPDDVTVRELYNYMNWREASDNIFDSEIEAVEFFAAENGLPESEADLSERFDSEIVPELPAEWFDERSTGGHVDSIAIREAFNDWTDALCKDGELHDVQYNTYCYVGKYKGE